MIMNKNVNEELVARLKEFIELEMRWTLPVSPQSMFAVCGAVEWLSKTSRQPWPF